ncbi:TetR/AcrR family transcriptional regulator [Actinoalloteichus hymeniacidonis]|uniref:TetR/AcrR family transcriptional regulator n=1 Tax=Actinoalloteichus hymeniacidonis TaxID=340345 RepID=UPI0017FAD147|nr:TetR/AcrR family transcriptional regulator [Actinoalloteichus hymeniacidonis]MBB5906943.1 DNA-binding transcriptional regulator YbjK [Actinoalloteichus hymeniacidonis]
METTGSSRIEVITAAAVRLLAQHGMRGLTHRAVDTEAALPPGSTSYYARTRSRLLEMTMTRLVEREIGEQQTRLDTVDHADLDAVSEAAAEFLHGLIVADRVWTLARFEFALEATRSPELRELYDRSSDRIRTAARHIIVAAGSTEPDRHTDVLLAWCDGTLFYFTGGRGRDRTPERAQLAAGLRDVLRGLLHR